MRKAFLLSDRRHARVIGFFNRVRHFHALPSRYVKRRPFAENSVEQPRNREQADVPSVQRRKRSPSDAIFLSNEQPARLPVGRGFHEQILDFIERQAAIGQRNWFGRGHGVKARGTVNERMKLTLLIESPRIPVILHSLAAHIIVANALAFRPRSANPEEDDLIVLDALRLRERIDAHALEVPSQNLAAICKTGAGNDKDQDTARLEPAIGMLEENSFHPLVLTFGDFKIVRRIAIKKRNGLCRAVDIESGGMDNLLDARDCLLCSVGIKLDSAAMPLNAGCNCSECVSFADAWIKRHETGRQLKMLPNAFSFWQRKWKIPETNASLDSHRGDYSFLPT